MEEIQVLKTMYASEGFKILGVFGSFARGEMQEESDIDLLYELDSAFIKKHRGFEAFARIENIRHELEEKLGKKVELAARRGLSRTGQKYILEDTVYV